MFHFLIVKIYIFLVIVHIVKCSAYPVKYSTYQILILQLFQYINYGTQH